MNVTYQVVDDELTTMSASSNYSFVPDEYANFYRLSQMITGLICYPIICTLGLTGNGLTLIVLGHKKMRSSTNVFLSALAMADAIKLTNDLLYFINLILEITNPIAANTMLGYMYPASHYIFNQSVCVSAWLTVSVAIERYIYVCHATRAKEICTLEKARIVSALVFIVMSLLALPSAFRYTSVLVFDVSTNSTKYDIRKSPLGENELFITVYTWIQNLARSVVPLFVLIVLNSLIIQAMRKQRVKGKKLYARNRITFMLIIVIVVFLLCITPDAFLSVFGFGYADESDLVKGIREYSDMLLAVNSAVNFLVYCGCSRVFRLTFKEQFCRKIIKKKKRTVATQYLEQSTFSYTNDGCSPIRKANEMKVTSEKNQITLTNGGEQTFV